MAREALVVGHYCHDVLVTAAGERRRELGGSVAYASAVLRAATVDYAVVSNVGDDFLYADRVPAARVVPGARTTSFVDDYRGGERVQTLAAVAPPVTPHDVREACSAGLAVPIAGEIPPATLLRMREVSRVLLADAQGFVRSWDAAGRVTHSPPGPDMLAALERVDYLKVGRDETPVLDLTRLCRSCTLLLTDGARGCTILTATSEHYVPGFPAREIDPTGAGDCFLAGFAVGVLRGWSSERAAQLGNWCGARAVEVVGIPLIADLPELD
ncbi:MAG TPA: PfkB family carbohydrate kinase [Myxococcales bacterium]|nr:PfkB family carbohydrate kinase [Myxococcales bacterium]